jgi:hypothetical protein
MTQDTAMTRRRPRLQKLAAALLGLTSAVCIPRLASAGRERLAEVDVEFRAERDRLIVALSKGQETEASLTRFAAILKERRERRAAVLGVEAEELKEKQERTARDKLIAEQQQGLDSVVGERCGLSVDPKKPPHGAAFMRADWGKVVVKQAGQLKARKIFDKPDEVTLYKIQGQRQSYVFWSAGPTLWYTKPFEGQVGDLVLICSVSVQSEGSGSRFPVEFREQIITQGFVTKIKEPPLITKKARYNPLHSLDEGSDIRVAISQGEWRLPEGLPLLARVMVKEDLGSVGTNHRYLMASGSKGEFLLDVPPSLAHRELLKPYRYSWIIMGGARPELERKTWLLVAQDIESSYVRAAD